MRTRRAMGIALAVAVLTSCSANPYPTNINLSTDDVGCEIEHSDQTWVVGPVPDGGSIRVEPDAATVVTIERSGEQLTVRSLRGSEEAEVEVPASRLNADWSPDVWPFIDGESFRPVYVRCWQQP